MPPSALLDLKGAIAACEVTKLEAEMPRIVALGDAGEIEEALRECLPRDLPAARD